MRLRNLLAATVTSALAVGVASVPALATSIPAQTGAGHLTTWGATANANGGPAITIPEDLTGPVVSVAATNRATGVVTLDGHVRVWGATGAAEAEEVPSGITNAAAISLSLNQGAVLHNDGSITGWGAPDGVDPSPVAEVPTDLRAKAIAVHAGGTGYAVRLDGTLTTWGNAPAFELPTTGLTDLVDVSVSNVHVLALRADGSIVTWGAPVPAVTAVPDFGGKKAVKITTGANLSGVVFEDGTIDVWGAPVPAGRPAFDGLTPASTVVSLGLWAHGVALTADGAVHVWGANTDLTTVPAALTGEPVSAVTMGQFHVAAIVTAFRDLTKPTIEGQSKVGQTLTATPATFSLTPDSAATGQWYAGESAIEGQTGTSLALTAAQLGQPISYRSTATRGDDTVVSASLAVGPVTPVTVASTTRLSVSPAKGAVGTKRTVTATVTSSGTPTGTVTFTLGSTTASKALTGGKATWILPAKLKVGRHQVTAAYGGDANTEPSASAATPVNVTKASAKVSAKVKVSGKTKRTAKRVTFTITVKAPKGVSPAGKVTVKLKGKKKMTVKVNAKGKAKVTIKQVKRGKHTATLKYTGNASVKAASGKAKFKA